MTIEIKLSPTEKRVMDIVRQGDIMCRSLPPQQRGAIPGLVTKDLIEIYMKRVSSRRNKKMKFMRLKP